MGYIDKNHIEDGRDTSAVDSFFRGGLNDYSNLCEYIDFCEGAKNRERYSTHCVNNGPYCATKFAKQSLQQIIGKHIENERTKKPTEETNRL